jgi:hypothetical protein
VRWKLALASFVVGVVLLVIAIFLDIHRGWRNIIPSLLMEFGVTFFLFAFLAWAEASVVQHVIEQTSPNCHVLEPPAPTRVVNLYSGTARVCEHDPPHCWTLGGERYPELEQSYRQRLEQ